MSGKFKEFLFGNTLSSMMSIAIAGMLMGIQIAINYILDINLGGVMKIGLQFVFLIIYGLAFGFVGGSVMGVIGYTLADGLKMGGDPYHYIIIPIGIACMSSLVKTFLGGEENQTKKQRVWGLVVTSITFVIIDVTMLAVKIEVDTKSIFAEHSSHSGTSSVMDILLICFIVVGIVMQITLMTLYIFKKLDKLKLGIDIAVLASLVIVVGIGLFGPYAFIGWMKMHGHASYTKSFEILLYPRVIKTPFILPIYSIMLYGYIVASKPVFQKAQQLKG